MLGAIAALASAVNLCPSPWWLPAGPRHAAIPLVVIVTLHNLLPAIILRLPGSHRLDGADGVAMGAGRPCWEALGVAGHLLLRERLQARGGRADRAAAN